ncbi:MAG: aldehyde dehydrogenase family protein [Deltaproteobacteria bacterium]|nr:aldehyde dehydrogenase family protein [Deltaproteobacteria bacterium]
MDGVFFVGSAETGHKIHKQTSENYQKSLVLEISAKNAAVIWEDANLQKAVTESLFGAFATAGQRCTSTGRIFVHKKIFDRFLDDIHSMAKKCRIGYALSDSRPPFMGPLISEETVENYLRYQGIAVREGCEEVMRGKTLEKENKGYYVSPSIHWATQFDPKSIYQQSEVFGPNVTLYQIGDLEEIIDILGKTAPGLVGSIYASKETYLRLIDEMRVGILNWNLPTTQVSYELPYGAPSGNYRPMGSLAPYQCTFPTASLQAGVDDALPIPPGVLAKDSLLG